MVISCIYIRNIDILKHRLTGWKVKQSGRIYFCYILHANGLKPKYTDISYKSIRKREHNRKKNGLSIWTVIS